jgi:putative MATE family efflux protein
MNSSTLDLMGNAPVSKAIIKLALPTMLGMIAQSVYNMTDVFFIGLTGDPDLVAGVALAMPLFFLTQGLGGIFAIGSASYISRKLGEGDFAEARRTNAVSFYLTIALGLAVAAICILFKEPILLLAGTSADTYAPTDSYFTIVAVFAVVMIQNVSLQGQCRSEGATTRATTGMVLGIAVNIAADPLFIFTFDMGIEGAAWATVVGAAISDLYFIAFFRSKKSMLTLSLAELKPNRRMLAEILKIGVPSAASNIVMSFSAILSNNFAAAYGDHVVAAVGVTMRVCSMAFMLLMGLALGFQPFAGYNYGAGNIKRLTKGLKVTLIYGIIVSVAFTVLFLIFSRQIIVLFIDDAATIDAGEKIMRAFVIGMPAIGVQVTLMTTFQALGKPVRAAIVTMGRQCLFFIPLLIILNDRFGFDGYVFAQPLSDIITTGIALALAVTMIRSFGKTAA